jgi:hypothetical protein
VEWSLGFTDSRLLNACPAEPGGRWLLRWEWFEEADREAVFERLNRLIEELEAVSDATELAVQRG